MEAKFWIEIIAAATILIAIVGVLWNRIRLEKGLSVRSIQFLGVCIFSPLILILALEDILERSATGALIGALLGYLLSNIGEYDKQKD